MVVCNLSTHSNTDASFRSYVGHEFAQMQEKVANEPVVNGHRLHIVAGGIQLQAHSSHPAGVANVTCTMVHWF
jgi:hypothetical protein